MEAWLHLFCAWDYVGWSGGWGGGVGVGGRGHDDCLFAQRPVMLIIRCRVEWKLWLLLRENY